MQNFMYTPYQEAARECFAVAYRFLDKHKHPRTEKDWERIESAMSALKLQRGNDNPLLIDLIVAVVSELEREYEESKTPQNLTIPKKKPEKT